MLLLILNHMVKEKAGKCTQFKSHIVLKKRSTTGMQDLVEQGLKCMLESKLLGKSLVPAEAASAASKMPCPPATSTNPG